MDIKSLIVFSFVPASIIFIDFFEKKYGSAKAGWLASFPLLGAPSLLIITIQHGKEFGAMAAKNGFLGLIGWLSFILWYRLLGSRIIYRISSFIIIFISFFSWLLCGLCVIYFFDGMYLSEYIISIILVSVFVCALFLKPTEIIKQEIIDIVVFRVLMGSAFVSIVVISSYIGTGVFSGLLTTFPLVSASLIIPLLIKNKKQNVIAMSGGMLTAGPALSIFMLSQYILLKSNIEILESFATSLVISIFIHVFMWFLVKNTYSRTK